jgi:hypothetical protein
MKEFIARDDEMLVAFDGILLVVIMAMITIISNGTLFRLISTQNVELNFQLLANFHPRII